MRTFNEADLLSLFSALRWTVVLVALALACGGPPASTLILPSCLPPTWA